MSEQRGSRDNQQGQQGNNQPGQTDQPDQDTGKTQPGRDDQQGGGQKGKEPSEGQR